MQLEWWDVYDCGGKQTGRVKARGQAPDPGEYLLGASLWIVHPDGRVLIQQRAAVKRTQPLKWSITGGAVLAGESSAQGCLREVREELGLVLDEGQVQLLYTRLGSEVLFHDYITINDAPIEALTLQPEEVAQARWATMEEIELMCDDGSFWFEDRSDLEIVRGYIARHTG